MTRLHSIPRTPQEWLREISLAYADALETLPFMKIYGLSSDENLLFHLAPRIGIKFRGLHEDQVDAATEAALSSYVASKEQGVCELDHPHIAFAFCYLAAHFGLELASEQTISEVMEYIELNQTLLTQSINTCAPHSIH